jgi:hypothetical protein
MNPFAGKSPTERNKIIAAIVLGFVALAALYMAFGRGMFATTATSVNVKASPTPGSSAADTRKQEMPTQAQQNFYEATTPVVYSPTNYGAPEAGRNIFAFYEPARPCPECPKPTPSITPPPTPKPTPTPPMHLEFVTPQTIYAGSGSFRLEVNGDRFDPSARIYFNRGEMPTQFVNGQKLVANIPASMVNSVGGMQVIVQTPDGKLYSEQAIVNVQAPPTPQFQYIGAKLAARGNNDTGYFLETGKQVPTVARLGDVVGGRFRLVSISRNEAIFQDVSLPFKHPVKLYTPPPGTSTSPQGPGRFQSPNGFSNDPNIYVPYNPNSAPQMENIPGIPNNIPRAQPPQNSNPRQPKKPEKDEDDDGDGGGINN